jgi:hypothetical protein
MSSGLVMSWEPRIASGALGKGNVVWAFCHVPSIGAAEPSAICRQWEPSSLLLFVVWPSRDAHTHHLPSGRGQLREGHGYEAGASGGRDGEPAGGRGDGRRTDTNDLVASRCWLA